jgi:hypothetical protein
MEKFESTRSKVQERTRHQLRTAARGHSLLARLIIKFPKNSPTTFLEPRPTKKGECAPYVMYPFKNIMSSPQENIPNRNKTHPHASVIQSLVSTMRIFISVADIASCSKSYLFLIRSSQQQQASRSQLYLKKQALFVLEKSQCQYCRPFSS